MDAGINITEACKSRLPLLQDGLALLDLATLELERSHLHLYTQHSFCRPLVLGSPYLLHHMVQIRDCQSKIWILTRDYDCELCKLEQVDLRLEVYDEILVELDQSVLFLQPQRAYPCHMRRNLVSSNGALSVLLATAVYTV